MWAWLCVGIKQLQNHIALVYVVITFRVHSGATLGC